MTSHVAIWLDHHEAHVFRLLPDSFEKDTFQAPQHIHRRHPAGTRGVNDRPEDEKRYFHELAESLKGTDGLLILGPSTAKLHFFKHLHVHDQSVAQHVIGIETVDHPTDKQVVAFARHYFAPTAAKPS